MPDPMRGMRRGAGAYNRGMRFAAEIFRILGGEDPSRVSYTVTDGGGGYFFNVKRVAEFSATRIVLRGKRGAVAIEGEDLALGKYFAGDVEVRGSISLVKGEG